MTSDTTNQRVAVGSLNLAPWDADFDAKVTGLFEIGAARNYATSPGFSGSAVFAPAISDSFVKCLDGPKRTIWQAPDGSKITNHDLRFSDPSAGAFHYPVVLYSAGQAVDTLNNPHRNNWLTSLKHDWPGAVEVLADSGGYQIQQGRLRWDPKHTGQKIQKWEERVATRSMTLDFPLGGIVRNTLQRHIHRLRKAGHQVDRISRDSKMSIGFAAALLQTGMNGEEFRQRLQQGQTVFLTVLQGRNEAESRLWYQQESKRPDLCRGFAFAGRHHTEFSMTLRRIVQMHQDGMLGGVSWFHFLGISTAAASVRLSLLQQALRRYDLVSPDFRVSFDSSSPFKQAAVGYQAQLGWECSDGRWALKSQAIATPENLASKVTIYDLAEAWKRQGPQARHIVPTFIGCRVPIGDLITGRSVGLPTMKSDQLSMLMHSNVQVMVEMFRHTQRVLDRKGVDGRPAGLKHFDLLLEAILAPLRKGNHHLAFKYIDEASPYLDGLLALGEFS